MKILAHEYLAEYDESLYIDNTVALKMASPLLFDALLPPDSVMALARHSFRGPLLDEYTAVIEQRLDAGWVCQEQQSHYQECNPTALDVPTLWSGLMLRRHNAPAVQAVMQFWWENVLRYSRRDQLSLPIALSAATFTPLIHDIDIYTSPYHEWPRWVANTTRPGRIRPWDGPDLRIAELEQCVADLKAELETVGEIAIERNAMRIERDAINTRCDELQEHIHELRASTSWRVTGPVRVISGALRRGRSARRTRLPSVGYSPGPGIIEPLPRRT